MELQTAIEILEYHQEWRLGKRKDMIHEPKKLTEALDIALREVKKIRLDAVSRRLFLVAFLGKDERGEIVKGIEVMADSSEDAMNLVNEISMSREIYSAIEV